MEEKDKRIASLEEENRKLKERLEELERRLGLTSQTSSKPPSTDGFRKPAPASSRTSTKPFGGQKGHKGKTLKQVTHPDERVSLPVTECVVCKACLASDKAIDVMNRQVFEVKVSRHVVQYEADVKVCRCGKRNVASFPEGVNSPVQYGNSAKSLGIYLMQHFVPKDRCSQVFQDLFQIPMSDTTLMKFEEECALNLTPCYDALLESLSQTSVKHLDESGLRVNKLLYWLHVLSNKMMTYYHVDKKRGYSWEGLEGTLVHDHWKSYYRIDHVKHALCNAHHLRELNAVSEMDQEAWAQPMIDLLLDAHHSDQGAEEISKRYDQLIDEGLVYHESHLLPNHGKRKRSKRRPGHNLLLRLKDYKADTLRFLYEEGVPFTNNQAEQDIRMVKVKQKVSGCFRSEEGAKEFAKIRSFVSTLRKQGLNLLEHLQLACQQIYPHHKLTLV